MTAVLTGSRFGRGLVRPGGVAFDVDEVRAGDKSFEKDGVAVVTDRKSYLYLHGTELDYSEGLMDSGFKLNNPNVKSSCGCGASFTV